MSVVNKMLQDLEQRQETAATADYQPPQKTFKRGYLLAFTLVLASVISAWYFNTIGPSLDTTNSALQVIRQVSQKNNDRKIEPVVTALSQPVSTTRATTETSVSTQSQQTVDSDTVSVSQINTLDTPVSAVTGNPAMSTDADELLPVDDSVNINPIASGAAEGTYAKSSLPVAAELGSSEKIITSDDYNDNGDDSGSLIVSSSVETDTQTQNSDKAEESTFTVQASDTITNKALLWRQKAKQAIASGQIPQAIEALEQLLSIRPEDFMAAEKLAWLQLKNSPEFAIQTLKQGLSHSPDAHTLRLLLAKVYQTTEQPQLALTVLTDNPPDIVFNPDFYALQGALAQQLGDTDIAYQSYYQLAAYQPNDSRWWLGLGVALDQQSNFTDAVEAYRRVQRLTNATPSVLAFVRQRITELEN